MIQYIYFVKCPGCEDEHFDFFNEAKEFALSCLSQKPIITQTEINRNDFGECTDHCDLGTVWSWEDMMQETEAEPAVSVFTKDDLKCTNSSCDPEFDNIDNSVDPEVEEPETSEVSAIDEIPDNFRKPIPEGMTLKELVEEMEENEDEVECTWCEDLFDKSECRYEINLGWLCSRCQSAIMSRGETLTFREGSYWDFLDEEVDNLTEASLSDITAAANSEFGTSWDDDYLLDIAGIDDDFRAIGSFGDNMPKIAQQKELSPEEIAEREAKAAEHERQKNLRFAQRYVAKYGAERYNLQYPSGRAARNQKWPYYDETTGEFVEGERKDELLKKLQDKQDAKRQAEYEERNKQPRWFISTKYNGKWNILTNTTATTKEEAEKWALDYMKNLEAERLAAGRRFDWKESDIKVLSGKGPGLGSLQKFTEDAEATITTLDTLEEAADYRKRLVLCPECGDEHSYDQETSFCLNCGFN